MDTHNVCGLAPVKCAACPCSDSLLLLLIGLRRHVRVLIPFFVVHWLAQAAKIADALTRDVHYTVDEKQKSVLLTEDG